MQREKIKAGCQPTPFFKPYPCCKLFCMSHSLSIPSIESTQGTVLRIFPCGEADLVFRLLTPDHGKIALIAKHVRKSRKRFAGSLDLFDSGTFSFKSPAKDSSSNLGVLQEFSPDLSFKDLRSTLDKIVCASLLCECYDLLTPENLENDHELYRLLQLGLSAINGSAELKQVLKGCFLSICQLLMHTGFMSQDQLPAPSANGLLVLLRTVEGCIEKELSSKPALLEIMRGLKPSA